MSTYNEHLRAQTQAYLDAPRVVTYGDPLQTSIDGSRWGANVAHAIAREQVLGNSHGEHGKERFAMNQGAGLPSIPQLMIRRGVSQERYRYDIDFFQRAIGERESKEKRNFALCCLTLGFSMFLTDCFGQSPHDKFVKACGNYVRGMNGYYNGFGITWSFQFIPYTGCFLEYEY